ncbi:MAG TPA: hypothetical protein VJV79_12945 [Polyangiaceae bacterium]|nr:hypothetical protein [Polyangiaceae bacterium]
MSGLSLTLPPRTHKTRAIPRELLYAWAMRVPRLTTVPSQLDGVSVALPASASPSTTLLPEECACCAQAATHRVALKRADGASLLVGYCDECAEHQASSSSRVLSLTLASVLLALSSAAGLPLLAPRLGLLPLLLSVCGLSLLPLSLAFLPARPVQPPHSARGLAVFWGQGHSLWCAAPSYAERVISLNGGALSPARVVERWGSAWLSAGPVLGLGAACLSFFVYHPLLRVLNLGPTRVEVALDGNWLSSVDSTSNESPAGGALLRVPAGAHTLSVVSSVDGASLGSNSVDFQSGAVHLFAIAADSTCFWLETTGYGREQRAAPSYQALPSTANFWVLPGGIDTWFAANPQPSAAHAHSSGGLLTALRQAPCAEAPQEVRPTQ